MPRFWVSLLLLSIPGCVLGGTYVCEARAAPIVLDTELQQSSRGNYQFLCFTQLRTALRAGRAPKFPPSTLYFSPLPSWFAQCGHLSTPALPQREQIVQGRGCQELKGHVCKYADQGHSKHFRQTERQQPEKKWSEFEGKMPPYCAVWDLSFSVCIHTWTEYHSKDILGMQ